MLLAEIRELGVVGGRRRAGRDATARCELEDLADQGVDIANGGWGKGSFLRWNRARNDVARAGKVIAEEAGEPAREFCPGRRLDAFDQYYSHRQKQKLVRANYTVRPENMPDGAAWPGRSTCSTVVTATRGDGDRGRRPRGAVRRAAGLRAAPLGELR